MVQVECCDLCYDIGEIKEAVARYWVSPLESHVVCKDCLKTVKDVKKEYVMLEGFDEE